MTVEAGCADVNGTRLYYEVAGSGEALVLVHGFALDTRMWDAQMEALSAQYRVIRYDMRGFGRSALPDGGTYAPADDQQALLRFLGVARAHLCGFSRGGMTAIDFALAYPQMVRTLVAADAVLSGYAWSPDWRARWRATCELGDAAAARRAWLAHPLFAPLAEKPDAQARLAQMVADYSGWHWLHRDCLRRTDAAHALEQMRMPVLAVLGERDLPDFHAIADLLADRAGAQKAVLAGVGHMSPLEDPAAFNRLVLEFLSVHRSRD